MNPRPVQTPSNRWEPAVPRREIHPDTWAEADKLRGALQPFIVRQADAQTDREFARRGVEAHRLAFHRSEPITEKHWWTLFDRTIERDRGFHEWHRLDLYLPDRIKRKPIGSPFNPLRDAEFASIQCRIDALARPMEPNRDETANLWRVVCETFAEAVEAGRPEKRFKRALLDYLHRCAPFLCNGSRESFRSKFGEKLAAWRASGLDGLEDKRPKANQARKVALPPVDIDTIIRKATFETNGSVALAWQEARQEGVISPETHRRFLANPSRLSYVPKTIMRQVKPEVDALESHYRGPRYARAQGAFTDIDWSKVSAGNWYQADDLTPEIYYYLPDGEGWFTLTRGQFIPCIDMRSKRILNIVLIDSRSYNSFSIKRLLNRTFRDHRLPRKGLALENGIWRSELVAGRRRQLIGEIDEIECGIQKLGLRTRHALPGNARAKIIENVNNLFQKLLTGEPGWVGRNEQVIKFERVQAAKRDVEAKRVHPAEVKLTSRFGERGFYSADEWFDRLQALCAIYNAKLQHSKVFGEIMSPDEAWERFQNPDDPQVEPDARWLHLVAAHTVPVKAGRNGIRLPFGNPPLRYQNDETGRLYVTGEQVLAHYDPDFHDSIVITDLNRENARLIPRANRSPADAETEEEREQLADAQRIVNSHNRYARERFATLRSHYSPAPRQTIVDPKVAEQGRAFAELRSQAAEKQRAESKQAGAARRLAERTGLPASVVSSESASWMDRLPSFRHPNPEPEEAVE